MLKTTFSLISKTLLTHDVYELIYACPDMTKESPNPGQYVMFQLLPGLSRAYSIASFTSDTFTLIIKRIGDGRWSPLLCDAEVGTIFSGMIPLGHFVLRDTPRSKCFIGTGTGFAPLYCQILASIISREKPTKVLFNFWVRSFADNFYESKIREIGTYFEEFAYIQYFSRETSFEWWPHLRQKAGYVTDWITPENIITYEEFYICGSPVMVKSAREKLEALGIAKEDIFWEQF